MRRSARPFSLPCLQGMAGVGSALDLFDSLHLADTSICGICKVAPGRPSLSHPHASLPNRIINSLDGPTSKAEHRMHVPDMGPPSFGPYRQTMSQQRHCPYCEKPFSIGYLELCTLPLWPNFRRWRGRCIHCDCGLQASGLWEILTGIVSTVALVAAFVLFVPVHPRPSNSLGWAYAVLALPALYFLNGSIRYMTISYPELS